MKVAIPRTGAICESLQGRDKGNLYCIVQVLDEKYVMVVDGDRKKLENPKRKNALHLHIFCKDITDFGAPSLGGKIYDSQIAFAIKLFKTELTQKTQQK